MDPPLTGVYYGTVRLVKENIGFVECSGRIIVFSRHHVVLYGMPIGFKQNVDLRGIIQIGCSLYIVYVDGLIRRVYVESIQHPDRSSIPCLYVHCRSQQLLGKLAEEQITQLVEMYEKYTDFYAEKNGLKQPSEKISEDFDVTCPENIVSTEAKFIRKKDDVELLLLVTRHGKIVSFPKEAVVLYGVPLTDIDIDVNQLMILGQWVHILLSGSDDRVLKVYIGSEKQSVDRIQLLIKYFKRRKKLTQETQHKVLHKLLMQGGLTSVPEDSFDEKFILQLKESIEEADEKSSWNEDKQCDLELTASLTPDITDSSCFHLETIDIQFFSQLTKPPAKDELTSDTTAQSENPTATNTNTITLPISQTPPPVVLNESSEQQSSPETFQTTSRNSNTSLELTRDNLLKSPVLSDRVASQSSTTTDNDIYKSAESGNSSEYEFCDFSSVEDECLQQSEIVPGFPHQSEIVPGYSQQSEIVPGCSQQSDIVPGFPQQSDIVPGFQQQSEIVSGCSQQSDIVPGFPQQFEIVPKCSQQSEIAPGFPQQFELVPGYSHQYETPLLLPPPEIVPEIVPVLVPSIPLSSLTNDKKFPDAYNGLGIITLLQPSYGMLKLAYLPKNCPLRIPFTNTECRLFVIPLEGIDLTTVMKNGDTVSVFIHKGSLVCVIRSITVGENNKNIVLALQHYMKNRKFSNHLQMTLLGRQKAFLSNVTNPAKKSTGTLNPHSPSKLKGYGVITAVMKKGGILYYYNNEIIFTLDEVYLFGIAIKNLPVKASDVFKTGDVVTIYVLFTGLTPSLLCVLVGEKYDCTNPQSKNEIVDFCNGLLLGKKVKEKLLQALLESDGSTRLADVQSPLQDDILSTRNDEMSDLNDLEMWAPTVNEDTETVSVVIAQNQMEAINSKFNAFGMIKSLKANTGIVTVYNTTGSFADKQFNSVNCSVFGASLAGIGLPIVLYEGQIVRVHIHDREVFSVHVTLEYDSDYEFGNEIVKKFCTRRDMNEDLQNVLRLETEMSESKLMSRILKQETAILVEAVVLKAISKKNSGILCFNGKCLPFKRDAVIFNGVPMKDTDVNLECIKPDLAIQVQLSRL